MVPFFWAVYFATPSIISHSSLSPGLFDQSYARNLGDGGARLVQELGSGTDLLRGTRDVHGWPQAIHGWDASPDAWRGRAHFAKRRQKRQSTFDPGDEHTMSPPALPPYCSMGPHDNATNPYSAPTPASIGGSGSPYYPDDGRSRSVCLSPFLLQKSSTTSFYHAKRPEDQNVTYDDESSNSNHNHSYETTSPDTMNASGYVGYISNPTAVSPQMYGTAAAASSSPWQAGSNSWPPVTTAPTAAQPFMSPQPNPYGGPGGGAAETYYDVDPQYDATVSVATISPGTEYPDPMSPSTAMSAESNRKKKRNHRRSSGSGVGRPVLTLDGLQHQQQHRTTQLRTAQRSSKYSNSSHKPAETAEERKARAMHNQVEQQYRKRLNAQFERLLAALPPEDSSSEASTAAIPGGHVVDGEDRRVSKAEVLDRARQRIRMLEKERASLERQKRELVGSVGRLRDEWSRRMGGTGVDGN